MNKAEYYSHDEVLFEIVKVLRGRETTFAGKNKEGTERKTFRCIKAHNVKFLTDNMRRWEFMEDNLNIYYSLAQLNNMPMFSYDLYHTRKKEQAIFKEEFDKYMVGFDFAIDFDVHRFNEKEQAYEDIKPESVISEFQVVCEIFDSYNIPYQPRCSGSGFHINIESKYFDTFQLKNKMAFFGKFNDRLSAIFNIPSICGSVKSFDKRMIWKCPYSYDYKSGNIALPLSADQVKNFTYELVKPENVIKKGIRDRGLLERKGSVEGLKAFLAEFIIQRGDV